MATAESGDAVNIKHGTEISECEVGGGASSSTQKFQRTEASGSDGQSYADIMDKSLFLKAVEGDIEAFKQYEDCLDQLVTPNDDSILNIYITALPFADGKQPTRANDEFMKWVAEKCPDLLRKQNKRKDTPLHIAARHGHLDIAIILVKLCEMAHENDQEKAVVAREMIAMKNEDKDTALHEALRLSNVNDQDKLEQLVILLTKDGNISYEPNMYGEAPLYLAAERGAGKAAVGVILQSQRAPAHGGPGGKTALHAAVIHNDSGITKILLANEDTRKAMIKEYDQKGWIPLHYAAYFGYCNIVRLLLKDDRSLAYTRTNHETEMIALHLAASRGQVKVMKIIIDLCPGCCELVDQRKWNVLHFAVHSDKEEAVTFVLKHAFLKNLTNKKNAEGSTPLHMLADSGSFMSSFVTHPQVDKLAINGRNLNVLDILLSADVSRGPRREFANCLEDTLNVGRGRRISIQKDEVKAEGSNKVNKSDGGKVKDDTKEYLKNVKEAYLVVAALIATVTFAAGFTVPGGYKGEGGPDEGGAILARRRAFQAFIITDTIALMFSSAAVLIHLRMAPYRDMTKIYFNLELVVGLTVDALFAMVAAFITGTYAVLFHTPSLAILTCLLGGLFLYFIVFPVGVFHKLCVWITKVTRIYKR